MAGNEIAPRVMPQSPEAEVSVLGSVLLNPAEAIDRCIEQLTIDHFYQRSHQIIYSTVIGMHNKGEPVDAASLTTRLRDQNRLEEVGGAYYLTKLAVSIPTAAHIDFYIELLKEKFILRRLIETATSTIQKAYDSQDQVDMVVDEVETAILQISDQKISRDGAGIKEITERMVKKVSEIQENRGKLPGLSWGFRDFNKLTFGLRPGEMVVIAARPGVGKTSLALNVAEKLSLEEKIPVGIFSLEMTAEQLALRMACSKARVNMWNLYHGNLPEKSLQEFVRAAGAIGNSPLYILDSSQLSINQLRATGRRLKARHDVKLIIVDYLQLMIGNVGRNDSREREVASISGGLKGLAKDLDVPVLVLAQLNRSSEKEDRKPRLSDLRESGAIEQDADVVCLLAQKNAYEEDAGANRDVSTATAYIEKNRNGPTGEIALTFFREYTRFEDSTEADRP